MTHDQQAVELSRAECLHLLNETFVGRVIHSHNALPEVEPVAYVMAGTSAVVRTAPGSSLANTLDKSIVAFEVDSVSSNLCDGWSVTGVGPADVVSDPQQYLTGRSLPPAWAYGDETSAYVRIRLQLVHGRRLTTRPATVPAGADGVDPTAGNWLWTEQP
ncbi:pyridoxamine 5'-phosphate oxidase family protein [Actinopolymorpha singaporensis]|uniref:Pyridoxamine 5'-phosphate oxidase n=1 Tax=Actinopolymorpha singaporensis TaxID=117157 RepID=A0A1H1TDK2_9ACTN|nr:pyridoxamine 5'-phosphate oxidase family protein [Actinopolymorpha singaporensis]SDS58238.1 Pyridoxamine 5'-phosphate oxidase [Actinopolymorpha singaporensis]